MTADRLEPAGAADRPAIRWAGETWSYGDFGRLIDRVSAPADGGVVDISFMTVPTCLAQLFAAARRGGAVMIHDPATPAPVGLGAVLPAGSWLIATTSGSVGGARAIVRDAASWAGSAKPLAELAGLSAADTVLLTGPLHATLHLHAAVHTLMIGAQLTDDPAAATAVHCVPAVLRDLLREPGRAPALRHVVVAGAALPEDLARRAAERGWSVTEYYGAAETSFVAVRRLPDPLLRPFPGATIRLAPDHRLWVRSPYLASGYVLAGEVTQIEAQRAEEPFATPRHTTETPPTRTYRTGTATGEPATIDTTHQDQLNTAPRPEQAPPAPAHPTTQRHTETPPTGTATGEPATIDPTHQDRLNTAPRPEQAPPAPAHRTTPRHTTETPPTRTYRTGTATADPATIDPTHQDRLNTAPQPEPTPPAPAHRTTPRHTTETPPTGTPTGERPAAVFTALPRDTDGFTSVGDLAAAPTGDPQDGIVIRGRGDIAVTTGGFIVLAEDVEAALQTIPGVRAAAAFGLPQARLGEIVAAAIELEPHLTADAALPTIRAAARALLPGPSRPRRYLVVDHLPRTSTGKIARAELRNLAGYG